MPCRVCRLEHVPTPEDAIQDALDADDAVRLEQTVSGIDWPEAPPARANRVLQRIALYGCSGRTDRYRHIIDSMIDRGCEPNLASCALLMDNDRAERILAIAPAEVFATDEDGATALHHAAERGNAPLADRLCRLGAPLDAVDDRGDTPLAKALHAGPWKEAPSLAVVDVLRAHGAKVDVFILAALGDADGIAETCAQRSGVVNETDDQGRTSLFHAARNNRGKAVRALLARGADPNIPTADGQTPLSTACLHTLSGECDVEIVEQLVGHGARMTLEAAIVLEDLDAVRQFVSTDPGLLDGQDHESALGYAIHAWHPASLRCLIEAGARPDDRNWGHIERIAGNREFVDELRRLAADQSSSDHRRTP